MQNPSTSEEAENRNLYRLSVLLYLLGTSEDEDIIARVRSVHNANDEVHFVFPPEGDQFGRAKEDLELRIAAME